MQTYTFIRILKRCPRELKRPKKTRKPSTTMCINLWCYACFHLWATNFWLYHRKVCDSNLFPMGLVKVKGHTVCNDPQIGRESSCCFHPKCVWCIPWPLLWFHLCFVNCSCPLQPATMAFDLIWLDLSLSFAWLVKDSHFVSPPFFQREGSAKVGFEAVALQERQKSRFASQELTTLVPSNLARTRNWLSCKLTMHFCPNQLEHVEGLTQFHGSARGDYLRNLLQGLQSLIFGRSTRACRVRPSQQIFKAWFLVRSSTRLWLNSSPKVIRESMAFGRLRPSYNHHSRSTASNCQKKWCRKKETSMGHDCDVLSSIFPLSNQHKSWNLVASPNRDMEHLSFADHFPVRQEHAKICFSKRPKNST